MNSLTSPSAGNALLNVSWRLVAVTFLLSGNGCFAASCYGIPPERLTCYEKQAFSARINQGRYDTCLAEINDQTRLACFDEEYRDPPPEAAPPAPSAALLRLEAGGGYGIGNHNGSFAIHKGALDIDSAADGSGPAVTAGLWWDDAIAPGLGLAINYVRIDNAATAALTLPKGISIFTDPSAARARASLSANLFFADIVLRRALAGESASVFAGAGIGAGWGQISGRLELDNPVIGSYRLQSRTESALGGANLVAGLDYDLSRRLSLSVAPQLIYAPGPLFGVNHQYLDAIITTAIALKFY